MLDSFKTKTGTVACLDLLLNLPKVITFIDWQEKNPQMMIILKIYVRQLFSPEVQAKLNQSEAHGGEKKRQVDLDKIQQKIS